MKFGKKSLVKVKCSCGNIIPKKRVEMGYKVCVECSTTEKYGCIDIIYHKTGNTIEILDAGTGYTSTPTVTITGDGFGATAVAVIDRGRIQRIDVTNTGIDYNRAVVTITGGGGFGASALALIDTKVGKLRTVYYNANAERQVVNSNVGEINYVDGIITLNDLNVISTPTTDGLIRVNCGTESSIIQSQRNTIVTIDDTDPNAILINLTAV